MGANLCGGFDGANVLGGLVGVNVGRGLLVPAKSFGGSVGKVFSGASVSLRGGSVNHRLLQSMFQSLFQFLVHSLYQSRSPMISQPMPLFQ